MALLPAGWDPICPTTAPSADANGSWRAALQQPRQMRPPARVSRTHSCLRRRETALYKQRETNQAFEFEHLPLTLRRRAGGGRTRCQSGAQGDGRLETQQSALIKTIYCFTIHISRVSSNSPFIHLWVVHRKDTHGPFFFTAGLIHLLLLHKCKINMQ